MDKDIKKVAVGAAKKAGKMLLKEYQNFDRTEVKLKHHREILTRADLLSEELIIKEISQSFPHHRILSEEIGMLENGYRKNIQVVAGRTPTLTSAARSVARGIPASTYLWIIDPVDGTTNFSMHNPIWSISIGVAYESKIVLGVVYAPVLDELYIAEKGKGVKLNGRKIKVSNIKDKALNTFCHAREDKHVRQALKYYSYQKMHGLDCRQMGSAAIELGFVAAGRTESIAIPGANAWDVAAGVLLVREADGKVTDFSGQEWNLESVDMLASNGKVHNEILKVLNRK